jgi:hypothetical protein
MESTKEMAPTVISGHDCNAYTVPQASTYIKKRVDEVLAEHDSESTTQDAIFPVAHVIPLFGFRAGTAGVREPVAPVTHELGHVVGLHTQSMAHFNWSDGMPTTPCDHDGGIVDSKMECMGPRPYHHSEVLAASSIARNSPVMPCPWSPC